MTRAAVRLGAVAAVLVAALLAGRAVAGSPQPGVRAATTQPRVGRVVAVSGRNTYVKRFATGRLVILRKGTILYLHDIIAAGPETKATLELALPGGLPAGTVDLLDFYKQLSSSAPTASGVVREFFVAPGALPKSHTLLLSRSGSFIDITLTR